MNGLIWIFFITLAISAFCAAMAAVFYLVEKAFFLVWGVKEEEADGLFWRFLNKGIKILLSISIWLIILVGVSGGLILVWLALYSVLGGA